ncbi:MAG: hypothetical protein ACI8Y4_002268 [Candidatus Poriferisodalaceae bacterium]|jgi:hypothetical protein
MFLLVNVEEVIHASTNVQVARGDVFKIEMPQPSQTSIEEVMASIPSANLGIHFLFDAASLRGRLGEESIAGGEEIWI